MTGVSDHGNFLSLATIPRYVFTGQLHAE